MIAAPVIKKINPAASPFETIVTNVKIVKTDTKPLNPFMMLLF